jgi:hypothetical protein
MPLDRMPETMGKTQSQHNYPVDAGRPIDPKDQKTLAVWREEGIDRFVKR